MQVQVPAQLGNILSDATDANPADALEAIFNELFRVARKHCDDTDNLQTAVTKLDMLFEDKLKAV